MADAQQINELRRIAGLSPFSSIKTDDQNEMDNIVKFVLTPETITENLEHQLRGEVFLRGQWVRRGEIMINDVGIRKVMMIVHSRVNRVFQMTELSEEQILIIMEHLALALRTDFFVNKEEYGMTLGNMDSVCRMVKDYVYAALKQAQDGKARNIWSKIQRVVTTINNQSVQKGRSWLPGSVPAKFEDQ